MIHVAVAVIENDRGEVLISKRHDHLHQGGLWEYPGGKVEDGEDVLQALRREIDEELGVQITSAHPLIRIPHDYGDKRVLLDTWCATQWAGEPEGKEGQSLQWVAKSGLAEFAFPAANKPITRAIQLPSSYVISPEPDNSSSFLDALEKVLMQGCRLFQLRSKALSLVQLESLAREVKALCDEFKAEMLINGNAEVANTIGCGVHLTASQLDVLEERPLPEGRLVAASCHSADALAKAARIEADFAVLSPVKVTTSHPDAEPVGWAQFAALCEQATLPIFALGGLSMEDIPMAKSQGGQGVAGISGFWLS